MTRSRKRTRRGLRASSVDEHEDRLVESDHQEEDEETQSAAQTPTSTPAPVETTDEARLGKSLSSPISIHSFSH
ncbi:hypothetical protein MJO28_004318 [Puccinia striiformis f. sp. tritici]|uniref:Uncharacterized protein n=1 Tax=Puccinia striiformis f. sp. tritici TaxID=168172 RepID=A0ACC0EQB0_9BASI|nr:hypothetical protein MJO28_004318 [Puccinia striiformis f. sp. tritici]